MSDERTEGEGPRIYTVGHSTRSINEFLDLLKSYGISVVVDVRRWPTSRKHPWFNREELEKALERRGIRYVWLGELLGGYREGGYESYMATESYRRGIEKLLETVRRADGPVAIMCSEKLWFRCHRRFISDTLTSLGYKVIHILDVGRAQPHPGRARYTSSSTSSELSET
ncbi:MAG: DUF488 domain-containing protein [Thermoproteota archaeon]